MAITLTSADAATLRQAIAVLSRLLNEADGSATIEIPVSEYHRLLASERPNRTVIPGRPCPRSGINRDEEVALFIADRADRMLINQISAECLRTFGADRTPSRSSIWRFIQRLNEY